MIDDKEEQLPDEEVSDLAELAEEITRRIEAGDPLNAEGMIGQDLARVTQIRELLPTLHAMVATGAQIAREDGTRARLQSQKKTNSP